MNNRKLKKNLFSDKMWNDTPYYDFFEDKWFKIGYIDSNDKYIIGGKNRITLRTIRPDDSITSWPERI